MKSWRFLLFQIQFNEICIDFSGTVHIKSNEPELDQQLFFIYCPQRDVRIVYLQNEKHLKYQYKGKYKEKYQLIKIQLL